MLEDVKDRLRPMVLAARRLRRGEVHLIDAAYGRPSFSQFGEDAILQAIFDGQDRGFYVDVGAYDPYSFSNTFALYRRGWHGINLEPEPGHWARLAKHRPRDVNLQMAVSRSEGTVDFASAGSFSGIVGEDYLWQGMGKRISVRAAPLDVILRDHLPVGQVIDLLDVDCEGHDLAILETMNWQQHRPRVVLAEWHNDTSRSAIVGLLEGEGYLQIARLRLTGVFTAEDFQPVP